MTKWKCPCNGCAKARRQVIDEVLEILDGGGDAYFRMHLLKEYIREQLPKKKETTPKTQG
jgi:hypothetical protein